MRVKKISHIAIAGDDADTSRELWTDILGLKFIGSEPVESEGVETAFFELGESQIEILEPLGESSPVAKFLEKRGPGLHHIALEVEDLDAYVRKLKAADITLLSEEPKLGAHDMRIIFIHPKSTGGVLIELCEKNPKSSS